MSKFSHDVADDARAMSIPRRFLRKQLSQGHPGPATATSSSVAEAPDHSISRVPMGGNNFFFGMYRKRYSHRRKYVFLQCNKDE